MATYGEIVSRVSNGFNSLTKDTRIPKRYILNVVKEVGTLLLSQRIRDKSLYRETNLFSWLRCVELQEESIVDCPIVEFRRCNSLMKSKKKLPKIVGSRYGYAILMVTNVDNSVTLTPITLSSYINAKNRKNSDKFLGKYYYIQDDRIYIPDSSVEVVDIFLLSLDEDIDEHSGCSDLDPCENVWDKEFPIPDKLSALIVQQATQEIFMRMQIPKDENSNLDSNQKSQTIE